MIYEAGFPRHMVHPQHMPAMMTTDARGDTYGTAMRFPPQMAETSNQEQELRAKGYIQAGEAVKVMTEYHEFPLMMSHPDHVDAIPDSIEAQMLNGTIQTFVVKGKVEVHPPVFVTTPEEEREWNRKGYHRAGAADAKAFDRAKTAPGTPGSEWPKWVDGVLMEDPDKPAPATNEFPKWCTLPNGDQVIVNSREEQAALIGPLPEPERAGQGRSYAEDNLLGIRNEEWAEFQAWKAVQATNAEDAERRRLEEEERAARQFRHDHVSRVRSDELARLRSELTARGGEYDKRWGAKRLQEAIAQAEADKAA